MFRSPVTNLLRLVTSNCTLQIERNLCHISTLHRICPKHPNGNLPKFSPLLERPLSVCLPKQRFDSQIRSQSSTTTTASATTNVPTANSAIQAEENLEEEEDDILYKTIMIEARCADRAVVESYEKFVTMAANYLGITISRVWQPRRTIKRRTLLRAAFVKKKYRVQYEWRTYYRNIEFKHLTGSTADTFLEYIERNLPESVALKVIKHRIEQIPSHLVPPKKSDS